MPCQTYCTCWNASSPYLTELLPHSCWSASVPPILYRSRPSLRTLGDLGLVCGSFVELILYHLEDVCLQEYSRCFQKNSAERQRIGPLSSWCTQRSVDVRGHVTWSLRKSSQGRSDAVGKELVQLWYTYQYIILLARCDCLFPEVEDAFLIIRFLGHVPGVDVVIVNPHPGFAGCKSSMVRRIPLPRL